MEYKNGIVFDRKRQKLGTPGIRLDPDRTMTLFDWFRNPMAAKNVIPKLRENGITLAEIKKDLALSSTGLGLGNFTGTLCTMRDGYRTGVLWKHHGISRALTASIQKIFTFEKDSNCKKWVEQTGVEHWREILTAQIEKCGTYEELVELFTNGRFFDPICDGYIRKTIRDLVSQERKN